MFLIQLKVLDTDHITRVIYLWATALLLNYGVWILLPCQFYDHKKSDNRNLCPTDACSYLSQTIWNASRATADVLSRDLVDRGSSYASSKCTKIKRERHNSKNNQQKQQLYVNIYIFVCKRQYKIDGGLPIEARRVQK